MRVLCVLFVALASMHDGKAVTENIVEKDASGLECTFETCGPSLPPIVMKENELYRTDSVRQKREFEAILHDEMIKTNFTCDDKPYIPGFYADVDTDCQIFHLCMKEMVDHYVCPNGTGFDQKYFICSPDGRKYCKTNTTGYIMNLRVPDSFPIPSAVEGHDRNWDRTSLNYKILQEYQTNTSVLDRDVIRLLLLLQFIETSHVLLDMATVEDAHGSKERAARTLPMFQSVLDNMIFQVFPLIPENYSSDPRVPLDHLDSGKTTIVPEKEMAARNLESFWYHKRESEEVPEQGETSGRPGAGERSEKSGGIFSTLKDPKRKALTIIKTNLNAIADVFSKISLVSRNNIVTNYANYLNKLSRSRTQRDPTQL